MRRLNYIILNRGDEKIACCGLRLDSLMSEDLIKENIFKKDFNISDYCHGIWIDFAKTISLFSPQIEFYLILLIKPGVLSFKEKNINFYFIVIGRGENDENALEEALDSYKNFEGVLLSTIQYANFSKIKSKKILKELSNFSECNNIIEIRRRFETLEIKENRIKSEIIGFRQNDNSENIIGEESRRKLLEYIKRHNKEKIPYIYSWVPSDESWGRLLEFLKMDNKKIFIIAHFKNFKDKLIKNIDDVSNSINICYKCINNPNLNEDIKFQISIIQNELARRLFILNNSTIACRIFLASNEEISPGLVSLFQSSIDDASISEEKKRSLNIYRGGSINFKVNEEEIFSPINEPSDDIIFSPEEVISILRTPMPTLSELPSIEMDRYKFAPFHGESGKDVPLGINEYNNYKTKVSLHEDSRFRHTYIIGQTGTGKSTLLLNMIINDIEKGRGVAVLDPHGTLISDILLRIPDRRIKDVIIVDPSDVEYPIGFNFLYINQSNPDLYKLERDYVIDDLYTVLDAIYDLKATGGPIFEKYFRSMLALLLGIKSPKPPKIPNFIIYHHLFLSSELRNSLLKEIEGKDPVVESSIQEILRVTGDISLQSISPYITSKINRFITDTSLRNILCQNRTIDLEDIINNKKILLFYLAKGRIGDKAAGLLAGQIIYGIRKEIMKRAVTRNITPFYIYADEFHLFANEKFAEFLAEGRKFKLSLTLAHQFTKQIPDYILNAVLGNVETIISFRISPNDAVILNNYFSPPFTENDLISIPNFYAYVKGSSYFGQRAFSLKLFPPPKESNNESIVESIRKSSQIKYGTPRKKIEEEIKNTLIAFGCYE